MPVKLLIALEANDTILLQISENEKNLAHVNLDRQTALEIATKIQKLAERIDGPPLAEIRKLRT